MIAYPEAGFASDREQWEEQEAKFCDQMIEALAQSAATHAERLGKSLASGHPHVGYSYLSGKYAYEISVMIHVWQQMADHLRQSRIIRIESERSAA